MPAPLRTRALATGVNHIDIAATAMPRYLGPLLPAMRERVFVSEKTALPWEGSWAQLRETLARLQTDSVDLRLLHGVTTTANLDSREGAVATLRAARKQGRCQLDRRHGEGEDLLHSAEAVRRYDLDRHVPDLPGAVG